MLKLLHQILAQFHETFRDSNSMQLNARGKLDFMRICKSKYNIWDNRHTTSNKKKKSDLTIQIIREIQNICEDTSKFEYEIQFKIYYISYAMDR